MKIMHISPIESHPCFSDLIEKQKKEHRLIFVKLDLIEGYKPHKLITSTKKDFILVKNVKKFYGQEYDNELKKTINSLLKAYNPDIIHIHVFSGFSLLPILNVASSLGVKKVLTLHDHSLFCVRGTYHDGKGICNIEDLKKCNCFECRENATNNNLSLQQFNLIRLQNILNIVNQSDKIICPSKYQKKLTCGLLGSDSKKFEALYYGIDLKKGPSKKGTKPYMFGYIGSLFKLKGIKLMLDAIESNNNLDFKVLACLLNEGKNIYEKSVYNKLLKNKRIKVIQKVDRKNIFKLFYNKINFLIIPSAWHETGPMNLFESFKCGVPIIINDIESMKEKIIENKNGFVFKNEKDLARIMRDILGGKKQIILDETAPSFVPIEDYYKNIDKIYREILSSKNKGDLCIRLGYKCNNNCNYCVTGNNFPRDDVDYSSVIRTLVSNRKEYDSITLSGGEPTIKKDFFKILESAYILGYKINIQTNGRIFCYKSICKKIKKHNISFTITINGPNKEIHDSITHSKGSFAQTIKGIENLLSIGSNISCKIILTKKNYKQINQTINLILGLGIKSIMIVFPTTFGTAFERQEEVVPTYNEIKPYLNKALKKYKEPKDIKFSVESVPYCILDEVLRKLVSEVTYSSITLHGVTLIDSDECYDFIDWRSHQISFFEQCSKCTHKKICPGVYKNYSDKRGSKEFAPIYKEIDEKTIQRWVDYHNSNKKKTASSLRDLGSICSKRELPEEVVIEVTSRCNLDCNFCFNKNSFAKTQRKEIDLAAAKIKRIIDNAAKNKIEYIRLTGGEPLLRKDLFELLKYAKSKSFKEVRLNTNGTLVNSNNIKKLEKYVDNVLIPLNSWRAEEDAKCTGMKDVFKKRINALKLLKKSKIKVVRSGTIASPDNIKHLEEIFGVAKSLRPDSWEVYRPVPTPRNKNPLSMQDCRLLIKKLNSFKKQGWFVPIANALPFCVDDIQKVSDVSLGAKYDDGHCRLVVDVRGYAKPSYFIDVNIGDPIDIMNCWNSRFMKNLRKLKLVPAKCKKCNYLSSCKAGSRFSAKLINKAYNKKDPLMP